MKMRVRGQRGFSLPTIIGLGVIAGLWMLGTAALVIPAASRITTERARDVARSSAEAALDWAVATMNDNTRRQSIDNQGAVSVPSNVLADPSRYGGTVTVLNTSPPPNSYLYDPTIDAANNTSSAIMGGNGWRVVTARVAPNGNAAAARTVRVILKPIYDAATITTTTTSSVVVDGDPVSMFNMAAFGQADIGGVGNMRTNSYDSAKVGGHPSTFQDKDGDIGTNTKAALTGNSHVGGDVVIATPSGTTSNVFSQGPNASVSEHVIANGQTSGANPSQVQSYTGDPVKLPPVPPAPANSTDLGAISLSGNKSLTLTAGNYVVSSISIAGNAQLNINTSGGPVNIYVQGGGANAGISIGGNGIANGGLPENLRIWYGGGGDTQIAGNGNFTGVVYAPNSNIKIAGNGEVFGSVVGNQVQFNGNGSFHYDVALGRKQEFIYIPPKTVTQTVTRNTPAKNINHWQAVSWDEM